jgi:hypothetical protein
MATSSEGGQEGKAPAEVDSAAVLADGDKAKTTTKKKMVRFTQQQIDACIANGEPTLPCENTRPLLMESFTKDFLDKLPQHLLDALARIDAERQTRKVKRTALQEGLRKERQDILDQYYSKGYAEYLVDVDEDEDDVEAAADRAPRPGRRRFRRGVVKQAGRTRKLN